MLPARHIGQQLVELPGSAAAIARTMPARLARR
jgi:hypothetical protein